MLGVARLVVRLFLQLARMPALSSAGALQRGDEALVDAAATRWPTPRAVKA